MDENTKSCNCLDERRKIGKVTPKERDEISALFERKNGLTELIKALVEADDEVLKNRYFYGKIVADLGKRRPDQQWWDCSHKAVHEQVGRRKDSVTVKSEVICTTQ